MAVQSLQQLLDLSGQAALVTGGAMGIGKGIAYRLAEAGAAVMIADINLEAAQATVDEFKALGFKASAVKSDVSSPADVEKTIQAVVDTFGGIDILVNNAGVYPMSPVLETSEKIWDRTININLKGTFLMAQAAARKMSAGKGGRIVNLASIDGFHPTGNLVHYDASKGGVVMMTKALALEFAKMNIRINAVAPGGIKTPGASVGMGGLSQEVLDQIMAPFMLRIPLGRQGDPDDIAKVVLFLACGLSDYVTGETVIVDGGYLLS